MAKMWVLVLLPMMMTMKSEAASAQDMTVSAHSDDPVLLPSGLGRAMMEQGTDVRWTHLHLFLSLKTNMTTCPHRRCEMLGDGSLRFSQVQSQDSGSYSLEVFYENGTRWKRSDFLLQVEAAGTRSRTVGTSVSILCCFLFLLILFVISVMRRTMNVSGSSVSGPVEENMYVTMISHHGNASKIDVEEEPIYVPCSPAASTETPTTKHRPEEADDVYV